MNTHPQYNQALYDQDFYIWTLHSAKLLRQGKFKEVDIENIADELESKGKRKRRRLITRLVLLTSFLLKWQFFPEQRREILQQSIKKSRMKIAHLLKESPSLNGELLNKLSDVYMRAILYVEMEIDLPENYFPVNCPYSLEQCLSDEFYPE